MTSFPQETMLASTEQGGQGKAAHPGTLTPAGLKAIQWLCWPLMPDPWGLSPNLGVHWTSLLNER